MSEYRPFDLERAFDAYEFREGMQQMSCSDGEPISMAHLLSLADRESKDLWDSLIFSYTHVGGNPLVLKELAQMYSSKCQILPAVPQEAILLAMMALSDQIKSEAASDDGKSDFEAIVTWPAYMSLHETLRSRGVSLKPWNLKAASDTEWKFDIDDLKALVTERTRLMVVNFPHNPSGFVPSQADWQALIDICSVNRMYLFSDEIYNADMLRGSSHQKFVLEPATNLYDRAITMSGLSKCFGLPGLRLGWLATENAELMNRMRLIKDYTTICLPAPVEVLGLIALRNPVYLTTRVGDIVERNVKLTGTFFARHRRFFTWRPPIRGTTGLVELLDPLLSRFDNSGDAFCQVLIDKFNVFAVCSSLFDYSNRYIRLGLGRSNLDRVLDSLESALHELGV